VPKHHAATHLDAVADTTGQRAKQGAAHHSVKVALAMSEPPEQVRETRRIVARPQVVGEPQLEQGI
jgi:hypothetical protein